MTNAAMEQKTAVFAPGVLVRDMSMRGREMDDETRELPLISGRFAGRQWIVEDLQREAAQRPVRRRRSRRSVGAMAACAAMAVIMLALALVGQARLAALSDQAAAVTVELQELREEQRMLRVLCEEARDYSSAERYAVEMLGMQQPRSDQLIFADAEAEDTATVLGVRRGQGATYLWGAFVDRLGECFH